MVASWCWNSFGGRGTVPGNRGQNLTGNIGEHVPRHYPNIPSHLIFSKWSKNIKSELADWKCRLGIQYKCSRKSTQKTIFFWWKLWRSDIKRILSGDSDLIPQIARATIPCYHRFRNYHCSTESWPLHLKFIYVFLNFMGNGNRFRWGAGSREREPWEQVLDSNLEGSTGNTKYHLR